MSQQELFTTRIKEGYSSKGRSLLLGVAMLDGQAISDAQIAIPLKTLNRHGLIAGATGTVNVKFTGSNSTTATSVAGLANTYEVIVPAGTTTGPVTVTSGTISQTSATDFQVWNTHGEPYVMPAGHLNVTYNDLQFILDQIKMSEAHADRTAAKANSFTSTLSTLSENTSKSGVIYPYDVTSVNRCLNVDDVAAAGNCSYGSTLLS
jgi:hypothetical protein